MNFDETPEQAAFRAEVRAFLDEHASLRTGTDTEWSNAIYADEESERTYIERCRDWQRTLYDNGWAGVPWPKQFGGRGGSIAEMIIFVEEAARYDVSSGFFGVAQSLVGPPLMVHGNREQQERYLPPLLRGDEAWCQLFSEPGAGSDLASLSTKAVLDGDEYVVTGQKVWTTQAQYADFGILLTRTNPTAPKHEGITFFVVDMRSPGVEVRPLRQASGHCHFNEVFLDEVRIPAADVVGEVDGGWAVTRTVMSSEAGMIGGLGGADPANFATLRRLARELGRDRDPVVRQGLADVYSREQIMRYLGLRFQTFLMNGTGTPPDPSILKNTLTAANERKVDLAMSIEGPAGMLWGDGALDEGLWQNSLLYQFASRIGGGTNEVHRNMIAERSLGLPRDRPPVPST
ncbi:MAG: acyl-CoA dehydrogenase family protein [Actinobacteria bacterium]|nr:acyl-CoA dehydrogenase family protein [Actinomycetota bacterium]